MKAYSVPAVETGDTPCESCPRRVSLQKDVVRKQGPGCVNIQPPASPTPIAAAPGG